MHLVASKALGIPQSSLEVFDLLKQAGIIDEQLAKQWLGSAISLSTIIRQLT